MALGQLDADAMLWMWRVNVAGPVLVTQEYLELLRSGQSSRVVNISSNQGSLSNASSGSYYAYSASKAALNMVTRRLAFDLSSDGIVSVAVNPGWVRTDMGGPNAPLSAEHSVAGILRVMDGLTKVDSGSFVQWDGEPMPW